MKLFFYPTNLDLRGIITQHNRKHLKYLDRYMYVIHRITIEMCSQSEEEGVRLNKTLLNAILGTGVGVQIMENLIKWEVIRRSDGYWIGKKSYTYVLNPNYDLSEICGYTPKDELFFKKASLSKARLEAELHRFLEESVERLTFDWPYLEYELEGLNVSKDTPLYSVVKDMCLASLSKNEYHDYDENRGQQGREVPPPRGAYDGDFTRSNGSKEFDHFQQEKNPERIKIGKIEDQKSFGIMLSLYRVLTEDYYLIVNKEFGRVYTNITNLKSELRQSLISKEDKSLIEIDIKNSQPFFLATLLIERYRSLGQPIPKDVRAFIDVVKSGELYESFVDCIPTVKTRGESKKKFMSNILFCKTMVSNKSGFFKAFRESFPSVAEYIVESKKQDHRALSKLLQRAESLFMIEYMGAKMMQRGWLYVTIHDSAIICEDTLPGFIRYMKEYFAPYGILPQLDGGSKHHLVSAIQ